MDKSNFFTWLSTSLNLFEQCKLRIDYKQCWRKHKAKRILKINSRYTYMKVWQTRYARSMGLCIKHVLILAWFEIKWLNFKKSWGIYCKQFCINVSTISTQSNDYKADVQIMIMNLIDSNWTLITKSNLQIIITNWLIRTEFWLQNLMSK